MNSIGIDFPSCSKYGCETPHALIKEQSMASSFRLFKAVLSLSLTLMLGIMSAPSLADDAQSRWYDPRTWAMQATQAHTGQATGTDGELFDRDGDVDQDNFKSDYEKLRLYRTINLASRQQMVGQRMLAGYCLGGLEDRAVADHHLNQSLRVFESQSERLKDKPVAGDTGIRATLEDIDETWNTLLHQAENSSRSSSAMPLIELTDLLIVKTNQLVERIVAKLDDDEAAMISESGRQRMLGQRVAALALCKKIGASESLVESKIDAIMLDLESSNRMLHERTNVNAQVRRELETAHTKIEHMRETINAGQWDNFRLLEISDFFVESMNRASRKLADSAAQKA